jgi:hypothetical protein
MKYSLTSDIGKEIQQIGKLISSVMMIESVRREVSKVLKDGFVVTDEKHYPSSSEYQVIVRSGKENEEVARRIRANIKDVDVDRIAEGVLGIRKSRRGSLKEI